MTTGSEAIALLPPKPNPDVSTETSKDGTVELESFSTNNVFEISQNQDTEKKLDAETVFKTVAPSGFGFAGAILGGNTGKPRIQGDVVYNWQTGNTTFILETPVAKMQIGSLEVGVNAMHTWSDTGDETVKTAGASFGAKVGELGVFFVTVRGEDNLHALDVLNRSQETGETPLGSLNGKLPITFGFEFDVTDQAIAGLTKISPGAAVIASAAVELTNAAVFVAPVWGGKGIFENGKLVAIELPGGHRLDADEVIDYLSNRNPIDSLPENARSLGEAFVAAAVEAGRATGTKEDDISRRDAGKIAVATFNTGGIEALADLTAKTLGESLVNQSISGGGLSYDLTKTGMNSGARQDANDLIAHMMRKNGMELGEALQKVMDVYVKGFPPESGTGLVNGTAAGEEAIRNFAESVFNPKPAPEENPDAVEAN